MRDMTDVQKSWTGPIMMHWGTDLWTAPDDLVPTVEKFFKSVPAKLTIATPSDFFGQLQKSRSIPDVSGEIPSSWPNIVSSLVHVWPGIIPATNTLLAAEKFATINYALGYAEYPQQEFDFMWKKLVESMDHNHDGQGGRIGDNRKIEYEKLSVIRGGEILRDSLRNIAERVKIPIADSFPIVVFNPLGWERDDVVKTHMTLYGNVGPYDIGAFRKVMRLLDEAGVSIPFHVEQSYGTVSRAYEILFVARDVPSLGYKTYFLVPAEKADDFPSACKITPDNPDQNKAKRISESDQFENGYYRVGVDRVTGSVTVFDKELGRVVAKDIEIAAIEERGGNSLDLEPATGRTLVNMVSHVELEEDNPVRAVMRIDGNVGGVPIVQRVFLYVGIKRVDMESIVDWREGSLMKLEQLFPYEQKDARIRYGIPFGSVAADDIMPNTGPAKGDEISSEKWKKWRQIQDWIFVGHNDWGLHISADRQSLSLDDDVIRVGMMRGTYCTQTLARGSKTELGRVPVPGTYIFRYSLCSGKGGWTTAKMQRAGMAFSSPLVPFSDVDELSTKSLPPTRSFCSLEADSLIVTALKKAEADGGIVLRAFEADGREAQTTVEFLGRKCGLRTVNLLEEQAGAADQAVWRLKPYEIGTVRLSAK